MSKTIYYLGAGASFGKREKDSGTILEGIPVVAEIPSEFNAFRSVIANAEIPKDYIKFWNLYLIRPDDVENSRQLMLRDIDSLMEGIKSHATIDTYARKLFLTKRKSDFNMLKRLLCVFFMWEQLEHKPDGRYDTFLANVLEINTLELPKDISIISWNYDSQFEMAFEAYRLNPGLPIYEKNIQGEWPALKDGGRIFKVNGSATFADLQMISAIKHNKDASIAVQLIHIYASSLSDTSEFGFQFDTHLSFAWEESSNSDNMRKSMKTTIIDTEQVVVIGYSFPFFNRDTDREIFRGMPDLKKIYVQDINEVAVRQSIQAVLPKDKKIEVVPISVCEQFYLPEEL